MNKESTKLNVESNRKVRRGMVKTVLDDCAIVYMNFKMDVERFLKGLKKDRLHDMKVYHGKNVQ